MPRLQTADEIRGRLRRKIEEQHGRPLDSKLVGRVARDAAVEPSTLRLYFGFYPKKRQTERLHEETLRRVLLALGSDPYDFLLETGDLQMELWPAAASLGETQIRSEGADHLRAFADELRTLPLVPRLRASRTAINAGIGSLAEAGEDVPEAAYELLRHVDESLSGMRKLKLLA